LLKYKHFEGDKKVNGALSSFLVKITRFLDSVGVCV